MRLLISLLTRPEANLNFAHAGGDEILNNGGTAYTGGGLTAIQYTNIVNGVGYSATATIAAAAFTQTSTVIINLPCQFPSASNYEWTNSQIANQALYLSNQSAPFATGNGTALLHLWYSRIRAV